jgi:hypothetical protein
MKKFVPIALLLCVLFSLSSFAPVKNNHMPVAKKGAYSFSFPINGTVSGSYMGSPVTWYYTVDGSGTTPSSISFSLTPGGTVLDSSPFYAQSPSTVPTYYATDLDGVTGITAAEFVVYNSGNDYDIDFFRF